MGFRFRRSLNLGGGFRLNLSKRGAGLSVGGKGFRVGVGPRGVRRTVSVPGTGMSWVSETSLGQGSGRGGRSAKGLSSANAGRPASTGVVAARRSVSAAASYLSRRSVHPGIGWIVLAGLIGVAYAPALIVAAGLLVWRLLSVRTAGAQAAILHGRAASLYELGRYADAAAAARGALERKPDDLPSLALLAASEYRQGNWADALTLFEQTSQLATQYPDLQILQALAAHQAQQYAKAVPLLQEALAKDPASLELLELLGLSFYHQGRYLDAIETFKRSPLARRRAAPELHNIRYHLALSYLETGEKKKAIAQLRRIYTEDAGFLDVAQRLGDLEEQAERQGGG